MKHQDRSVRIIGGKWRGRKVTFRDGTDLRPTGDRIRETLFNWLMNDIRGANCLDLFAGSGALSIEALSRGAAHVTIIERDRQAGADIQHSLTNLGAETADYSVIVDDALAWANNCENSYDIVFVDPPFSSRLHEEICQCLASRGIAKRFVYIESDYSINDLSLPDHWDLYREKRAASVHYGLCIAG